VTDTLLDLVCESSPRSTAYLSEFLTEVEARAYKPQSKLAGLGAQRHQRLDRACDGGKGDRANLK
jgi:hypothetical protein